MFYYSKKSHRKIVHTENCFTVRRMKPESVGTFDTLASAFSVGYRLCRHCNPIARQYRKEYYDILDYCYTNGISCYFNDRHFTVTTPISKWKMTVSPDGKMQLFHKNTRSLPSDKQSPIAGYHIQGVHYQTMTEYLKYITDHDSYREKHPEVIKRKTAKAPPKKGTKRWHKQQAKLKRDERRQSIQNVLAIIDSFDSNYAVRKAV